MSPYTYFPRVKEAREALKEKALELYESYLALATEAKAAGHFQVAEQILWKLIEHMPKDDDIHMIDISIDKPKQVEQKGGPTIQIGFQLGGMEPIKELPPSIIDIIPESNKD